MCLDIEKLKFNKAKSDVVCYKILWEIFPGEYYTPFQMEHIISKEFINNKIQEIGNYHNIAIHYVCNEHYCISEGFIHTYAYKMDAINMCDELCATNKARLLYSRMHVFKCIIPSGELYTIGECSSKKSYASDSIIYEKEVYSIGEFDGKESDMDRFIKFLLDKNGPQRVTTVTDVRIRVIKELFRKLHIDNIDPSKEIGRLIDNKYWIVDTFNYHAHERNEFILGWVLWKIYHLSGSHNQVNNRLLAYITLISLSLYYDSVLYNGINTYVDKFIEMEWKDLDGTFLDMENDVSYLLSDCENQGLCYDAKLYQPCNISKLLAISFKKPIDYLLFDLSINTQISDKSYHLIDCMICTINDKNIELHN